MIAVSTWAEDPLTPAARVWEDELDAAGARDPADLPLVNDEAMNTVEKVRGLLLASGIAPGRIWLESLEHAWDPARHFALRIGFGRSSRRLSGLAASRRADVLERIRARLAGLGREDYCYRACAICAIGHRDA
ncbi:MAG: hypothetical protein HY216_12240 [Candidatus Rokubacteria bacterium]|nr:hypothetical protein [Candidatus Rokubacteria bacterium]